MANKTIVVVGGVAGGMSFATRYRRLNEDAKIIVIDKGPYVSFANCGLPYYVSNEITDRSDLIVTSAEELTAKFNLDVRVNSEVVKINKEDKTVEVLHNDETYTLAYDDLVLSLGAKPIFINIENIENKEGVFTLRNIPDVDKIMNYIDTKEPKSAVVIGAGFIGLEMVESLKNRGLKVSVVEKAPQVLAPLDEEMAKFAENELIRNEIDVHLNTSVTKFEDDFAILEDGSKISADIVIMSVGVLPDTKVVEEANIELGFKGGIKVNDKFQTSDKNIHAVGDAIIVKNIVSKEDALIPLASPANRQGRQLADILSGLNKVHKGSLGTSILRLFDLTFASTGLNQRQLGDRANKAIHLNANDHAGYFPNATPIYLKVIYDPSTHEILGAQALGKKGVDKRIDILATAIKANFSVTDLQELELTYAPPYGSAKDIVNMAGYVAENQILNLSESIQYYELEEYKKNGAIVVDVRGDMARAKGYIKDSIHIPLNDLRDNLDKLDKSKTIILSCQTSVTSYNAERILRSLGYDTRNLDGAFSYYSVVRPDDVVIL